MAKPKVTVVIPTHNRPMQLVRALHSIESQTFQDYEVIVVDDGDSPRAESVLQEYLGKSNLTYLETNKNQGAPVARNMGIKAAQGEYVAFLDDDDEWKNDKLEKQVKALDQTDVKVSLVFNGVMAVDKNGEVMYQRIVDAGGVTNQFKRLLTKCNIWTSSLMIKKTYLDQGYIYDELQRKNQEWDLELRLAKVSDFYSIPEPLTVIHIGETEQMGSDSNIPNIIHGTERLLEKHKDDFLKEPHAYALQKFKLGDLYYRIGKLKEARTLWLQSWKLHPASFMYSSHWLVLSISPSLYKLIKSKS